MLIGKEFDASALYNMFITDCRQLPATLSTAANSIANSCQQCCRQLTNIKNK